MNRAERRGAEKQAKRNVDAMRDPRIRTAWHRHTARIELDASQADDLSLFVFAAIDGIRAGNGAEQDLSNLAVAANLSLMLCEQGYGGADVLTEIHAGQDALVAMLARHKRTGKVGATGQELQALRTIGDIRDQQLRLGVTAGVMREAFREMKRRMAAGQVLGVAA